jgi:hypothetical protein
MQHGQQHHKDTIMFKMSSNPLGDIIVFLVCGRSPRAPKRLKFRNDGYSVRLSDSPGHLSSLVYVINPTKRER